MRTCFNARSQTHWWHNINRRRSLLWGTCSPFYWPQSRPCLPSVSELDVIRKLSGKVREACEKFAISNDALFYDFYNDTSLNGMCAIASVALHTKLQEVGIKTELINGIFDTCGEHCWIVWDDKWIVDITATQFNNWNNPEFLERWDWAMPVHIVGVESRHYHPKYIGDEAVEELKDWDFRQRPDDAVVERVLELI